MNDRFSMFDHDVMGDGVFEQGFVGHVFTESVKESLAVQGRDEFRPVADRFFRPTVQKCQWGEG